MPNTFKTALVQTDLVWENAEENRINLTNKLIGLNDTIDLVILPEMFTTGFSMQPESLFETMNGDTQNWMQEMATQNNYALMGSLIIKENNNFYNRLLFVYPDGKYICYDKRHTFTLAGEHKVYKKGKEKVIINYKDWKICPMICYDLRFPAWSRNMEDYDLLIYTANWPKKRIAAWDTLLAARAIENMSYCIGVNRVGIDGNNYEYDGHSAAYDMLGNRLDSIKPNIETIETVELNKEQLYNTRKQLNFLSDRDLVQVLENPERNQN